MDEPTDSRSRSRRLRELISRGTVALPGAINALSARLIEREGFDALYLSGAVLANSVGGVPDVGLMTLTEARQHAAAVANVTTIPIIMDADTGYGGPDNAARTVRELESAGVSGIHLEDQEFPKRCGHLEGKRLVPMDEMCEKIAAAVAAKSCREFLVIARTDARGVTGYDDAVARAHHYLQAGADALFPEALSTAEEFARFARDVKTVLLANMTEFGKTPYLSVDQFAAMGYKLVIFPVTLQRAAMKAVQDVLRTIRRDGTQRGCLARMQTRDELYDLLEYDVTTPTDQQSDRGGA
ncbi:MAG: methylisocitrate lyase [Phycisphaerales bacterium]|nr:methylisocitrate lyase [Phycisphaerales bacterium]